MSQHLSGYRDWSAVPSVPLDDALVIDLTRDDEPSMVVDVTDATASDDPDAASPKEPAEGDAGFVSLLDDDWDRMARAARAILAAKAAAKVDAGLVPLGLHVDLRG